MVANQFLFPFLKIVKNKRGSVSYSILIKLLCFEITRRNLKATDAMSLPPPLLPAPASLQNKSRNTQETLRFQLQIVKIL